MQVCKLFKKWVLMTFDDLRWTFECPPVCSSWFINAVRLSSAIKLRNPVILKRILKINTLDLISKQQQTITKVIVVIHKRNHCNSQDASEWDFEAKQVLRTNEKIEQVRCWPPTNEEESPGEVRVFNGHPRQSDRRSTLHAARSSRFTRCAATAQPIARTAFKLCGPLQLAALHSKLLCHTGCQ